MYVNSGQVCTSGTRLIAHKKIVNQLVDKLIEIGAQKIPGVTWDDKASLPPIVSKKQADRIDLLISQSIQMGANIISGGSWHDTNYGGYFYKPTFIEKVTKDMPV